MGQGERQPRARRAAASCCAAGGRASLAALAAIVAVAGCSGGSSNPADDLPPLPRYWQGSISSPPPDAWAARDASTSPAVPHEAPPVLGWPPPSIGAAPQAAPAAQAPVVAAVDQPRELAATPTAPSGTLLPPEALPIYDPTPAAIAVAEQTPLVFPPHESRTAPTPSPEETIRPHEQTAAASSSPAATNSVVPVAPAVTHSVPGPTGAVVNDRARARIQHGYELAGRGAYFAARNEFVAALQMIAAAKDQRHGSPRRTVALAAGLRALDEAEDFSPQAATVSPSAAAVIVAAHRTPVAKNLPVANMLPEQLVDAYLSYADEQLAAAVAGEPAGSMALHAMGKLESRLGAVEPEANPQSDRRAFALQQAALLARSDNHLAAHELGVLLAESGHFGSSNDLLRQVATHAPHPVVFRNLARVQRRLGQMELALASERQADSLAARGVGGDGPVQWVSTDALARTPDASGQASPPRMATAPAPMPMHR